MSPEPQSLHETHGAPDAAGGADSYDYWHALINEKEAGAFLDLTGRAMQAPASFMNFPDGLLGNS